MVKHFLKRFNVLVVLLRVVRQLPDVWNQTTKNLSNEKQNDEMKFQREIIIENYLSNTKTCKLQIGAGSNCLKGWLNTDLEPIDKKIIFLDATQRFPFGNATFEYVYCEHMIEHITYTQGMFMLNEIFRILKPKGKVRIATPNLNRLIKLFSNEKTKIQKEYIEWSMKESLGLYSPELSKLQKHRIEWDINYQHFINYYPDLYQDSVYFIINNFFRSYGHRFIHSKKTLSVILASTGFVNIDEYSPGYSKDENLCGIESHGKSIGEDNNLYETMVFEATRL